MEKKKLGRPKNPPKVKVKSKGSPRKPKPSIEVIGQVLKDHYGIITKSAEALGITSVTLYKWINESVKLTEIFKESRILMIDTAESQLMKNITAGKETSVIFFLKCLGKQRGYIDKEQPDVQITNNTYKQINIIVQDEATKNLLDNLIINTDIKRIEGNGEENLGI